MEQHIKVTSTAQVEPIEKTGKALRQNAQAAEAATAATAKLSAENAKFVPPRGGDGRFLPRGSAGYQAARAAFDAGKSQPSSGGGGGTGGAVGLFGGAFDSVAKDLADIPGFSKFQKLASGPVGASLGAAAGLAMAIREYAQAQEVVAKLDAALAQNGLLTDANREKYQALAGELQKTTAIADEEWIAVLTRLTQFGSTPASIGMDVEAVKNLAGLMGGDVQSAVNAYSRALQGNFELFGRYGIVVGEAGTQTEKLQKLQEQLAQRGGGQLEASAKTLTGQFRSLKNASSDLFEAIGRGFSSTEVGQGALFGLTAIVETLAEEIGGAVPPVDGLTNKLGGMAGAAGDAEAAARELADAEDRIKRAVEGANTALSSQLKLLAAEKAAADDLAKAQLALAEARIRNSNLAEPEKKVAIEALRANAAKAGEDRDINLKRVQLAELNKAEEEDNDRLRKAVAAKRRAEEQAAAEETLAAKSQPERSAQAAYDAAAAEARAANKAVEDARADKTKWGPTDDMLARQKTAAAEEQRLRLRRDQSIAVPAEARAEFVAEFGVPQGPAAARANAEQAARELETLRNTSPQGAQQRQALRDQLTRELNTAQQVQGVNQQTRQLDLAGSVRSALQGPAGASPQLAQTTAQVVALLTQNTALTVDHLAKIVDALSRQQVALARAGREVTDATARTNNNRR